MLVSMPDQVDRFWLGRGCIDDYLHFAFLGSIQTIVTARHFNCDFDFDVLCIVMGWCSGTASIGTTFCQKE